MEKQLVTVTRKWHEPFIRVDVTEAGIAITMTLEDFVAALACEMGADANAVSAAASKVVAGMKQETVKVM